MGFRHGVLVGHGYGISHVRASAVVIVGDLVSVCCRRSHVAGLRLKVL